MSSMDAKVNETIRKSLKDYCKEVQKKALNSFDRNIILSSASMQLLASIVEIEYNSEYERRKK